MEATMTHNHRMGVTLALALLAVGGCWKKGDRVLRALPAGARVVFSLDFSRLAQQEFFDRMVCPPAAGGEEKSFLFRTTYREFVSRSGIDPKRDVSMIAGSVYGELSGEAPEFLLSMQVKYDQNRLLSLLRQAKTGLKEERVRDVPVCSYSNPSGRTMSFALLANDLILAGSAARVRQALDLANGRGWNVLQDKAIRPELERVNRRNMFWLALTRLPDSLKKGPRAGLPIPLDLSRAEALLLAIDCQDRVFSGDLQLMQSGAEANAALASTLDGFKGVGAMLMAKEPGAGELFSSIRITSSADSVRLTFSLPEPLLEKVAVRAGQKSSEASARAAAAGKM
jgi:hypothetical protein